MPKTKIVPADVGFDRTFIEKWLDRQKYVWYFIVLFLAVAFSGLLGHGPLTKTRTSAGPGQLSATYERCPHFKTPSSIELYLPDNALEGGSVRLMLEGAIAKQAAFQEIIPQPVSAAPLRDGMIADIPVTTTSSQARIMIFEQPSTVGPLTSKITLQDGSSVQIDQFVLP